MKKQFDYKEPIIYTIDGKDYNIKYGTREVLDALDTVSNSISSLSGDLSYDTFVLAENVCRTFLDLVIYKGAYDELITKFGNIAVCVNLVNSILEDINIMLTKVENEYTN